MLKREINNYEKVPVVSSRAQQMQCEEQGAVVQILRNYVKERYLW